MRPIALTAATILLLAGCSSETSATTTIVADTTTTIAVTTTTGATTTTIAADPTTTAVETTTTTTEPGVVVLSIAYEGGEVTGGGRIEVPLGEFVELTIVSDVGDEGHLHGYDIFVDLEPGTPGTIEFTADIPGIFELELEGSGVLLADLEVAP